MKRDVSRICRFSFAVLTGCILYCSTVIQPVYSQNYSKHCADTAAAFHFRECCCRRCCQPDQRNVFSFVEGRKNNIKLGQGYTPLDELAVNFLLTCCDLVANRAPADQLRVLPLTNDKNARQQVRDKFVCHEPADELA